MPLLLSCKRIHACVTRIIYSNTQFCFTTRTNKHSIAKTALRFFASLSDFQSGFIRRLHLQPHLIAKDMSTGDLLSDYRVEQDWRSLFSEIHDSSLRRLTCLKELSLEFCRSVDKTRFLDDYFEGWEIVFIPMTVAFRGVKHLRLKRLNVLICQDLYNLGGNLRDKALLDLELEKRIKTWLLDN